MRIAVITLTRGGVELGLRLNERLEGSELFVPEKHGHLADGRGSVFRDLKALVESAFSSYEGLIFVMATGIVVRTIAPLMQGKELDPAVVVMDEAGRFAISLISGHLGGANELASRAARATGGVPVITTATDVREKRCAEDLAKDLDCEIENVRMIKTINSAILHDEPVAAFIPRDSQGIVIGGGNWYFFDTVEDVLASGYSARIVMTNRLLSGITEYALIFRPRNLVVGVGCNRNTSAQEMEDVVFSVLKDSALSLKSVRNLATIDIKNDEAGLLAFALKNDFKVDYFSKEELQNVKLESAPSRHVMDAVGVGGVCEPAAMLSARSSRLLVPKVKSGNVTVAVAESQ